MKKGLLLLVLAGAFLVSCGGGQEKEAAKEFCACYADMTEATSDAGDASSTDALFGSIEEMKEAALKAQECRKVWDEKYNGKVDLDVFKEEVKKENEAVYNMAVEEGVF